MLRAISFTSTLAAMMPTGEADACTTSPAFSGERRNCENAIEGNFA